MASDKVKLTVHTSKLPEAAAGSAAKGHARIIRGKHADRQNRLLRNSCFACAILLGILALGNVQQPWAQKASSAVEKALTMEIDLDKSLGQLSFVQKLMPESALVFFNLNGSSEMMQPVKGNLTHAYSETQPWLMFETEPDASVCAAADGVVSAVSPMANGGYGILIDHGSGRESVSACLNSVDVENGDSVLRGGIIGKTNGDFYFELRENGESIDPTEKLGL